MIAATVSTDAETFLIFLALFALACTVSAAQEWVGRKWGRR